MWDTGTHCAHREHMNVLSRSHSAVAIAALACAGVAGCTNPELGSETLMDTGWIGANSFEVSTVFRAALSHPATGRYAELATRITATTKATLQTAQAS